MIPKSVAPVFVTAEAVSVLTTGPPRKLLTSQSLWTLSIGSTLAVSFPLPQPTKSTMPSLAKIVSLPSPPRSVSAPPPQSM
jgi:hypothetical protein